METLYFALGILSVLVILGVVGIVMVWKRLAGIEFSEENMEGTIDNLANDINHELEILQDYFKKEIVRLDLAFSEESKELGKMVDSRLDKLERKIEMKLQKIEGTLGAFIVKNNK